MFNNTVKEQVLFLNEKTYGLENEVKYLENKIRLGQNKVNALQRELKREGLHGKKGHPLRMDELEDCLNSAIYRISILEEMLSDQFDLDELSSEFNEKVIAEQYREDVGGYFLAMVNYKYQKERYSSNVKLHPYRVRELIAPVRSGLEQLRNRLPMNLKYEIYVSETEAFFQVGHFEGEISVKSNEECYELRLKKMKDTEGEIQEYFQASEMLQAIARIFALEVSSKRRDLL